MASVIPANQARFTQAELVAALSAEVEPFDGSVEGIWTDSRGELGGGLFIALRGEHFDGHHFASAAARRGARVLVVEEPVSDTGSAVVVRVASTLTALGSLALFHRRRWGGRVVGVAGSVGKTTTRSSVAAVLRASGLIVHSPAGNLNNLIGVPLVLLGLEARHPLCVVEIGTNAPGEVERICAIAEPDVGVLTRIALEHSAGLGDLDAIEREEGALLGALGVVGAAVVNADDERCLRQLARCKAQLVVRYGLGARSGEHRQYRIAGHSSALGGSAQVRLERPDAPPLDAHTPLLGLPGAYALAAAVATAEVLLGRALSSLELANALADPALSEPGRLTPVELSDGTLVLDDTYNASPASVRSSIAVALDLAGRRGARLVLVLGEMLELGALSIEAHRELGADIAAANPALVIGFGGDAAGFLETPSQLGLPTLFAPDAPAALAIVARERRPGDVILVKASRGLRGERIVAGLRGEKGTRS